MYKVTLSMPIYNVAPYVERALLSALNQTFESIEFLLVDDKGTDNSMEIVRRIIKDHPRGKDVRIIEHPYNIGTGATKNTAIDNAQGEFLFFMDSDDEITPDCIQLLYDKMKEDNVDFVAGSFTRCKGGRNNVIQDCILPDLTIREDKALAKYYYYKMNVFYVPTWNKLYNLSFIKKNNIRCISYHINEDLLFLFRIALNSHSFSLVSNVTYYYYLIDNSTTVVQSKIGESIKSINQYKDVISAIRLSCFYSDSDYYGYGYLFVDNYLMNIINISFSLIKSKMISIVDKREMLKYYCDVSSLSSFSVKPNIFYIKLFYCFLKKSNNYNYICVCVYFFKYLHLLIRKMKM